MTFSEERVLVLGGTSGIGLAVAALAAGVTGEVADLTDAAAVTTVDHLVFTAGEPLLIGAVGQFDLDAARAAFGLRYVGALAAVTAAVPHLRPGGSGGRGPRASAAPSSP